MMKKQFPNSILTFYTLYMMLCCYFFVYYILAIPDSPLLYINYKSGINYNYINECIIYQKTLYFQIPTDNLNKKKIFSLSSMNLRDIRKSNVTYYILKNVLLGNNYQILYNGTYMNFFGNFEFDILSPYPLRKYKEAICLNHYHTYFYGTLLHDIFPAFLIFPRELLESLPIIISYWYPQTIEFMRLIGIKSNNIINLTMPEYIYVEKLHTLHDIEYNLMGTPLINVTKIFQRKYNLNNYPATKYVIFNRPKNKLRHVINLDNFTNHLFLKYPEINWEIIEGHIEGLKPAAIFWTQIKLVFSVVGSGLTSGQPFMKENSVNVCLMLDWPDPFIYYQAISCKLILITWRQKEYKHFESKDINISLINASIAMNLGVMLSKDPNISISQRYIDDKYFNNTIELV